MKKVLLPVQIQFQIECHNASSHLEPLETLTMTASAPTIKLDQFLKLTGMVQTGGEAKLVIQAGEVTVNGVIETRRGRKLLPGDYVTFAGETFEVGVS
jgi:ribosome-associated protein